MMPYHHKKIVVSVIVPAYQAAGYIAQALDSIFMQTFSDYEVIVINDGSPDSDGLEKVLQPYKDRIRYINQENRGPSGARNAGILQACGRYVAFLDSDDMWQSDHLALQMAKLLEDESLGLVYSDYFLITNGAFTGRASEQQPQSPEVSFRSLLLEQSAIGTSSVVASRQAIIDTGMFDEKLRRCEDFDLWLRLALRGAKIVHQPAATLFHRERNGLSSNRYLLKQGRIEVYKKLLSQLPIAEPDVAIVRALVDRAQADCDLDEAKEYLGKKEYGKALQALERTNLTLREHWKFRLAVLGLRRCPDSLRRLHRLYQWCAGRSYIFRRLKKSRGIVPSAATVGIEALKQSGFEH